MKDKFVWPMKESDAIMEKYLLNHMYGRVFKKEGFFSKIKRKLRSFYFRFICKSYPEVMMRRYLPVGSANCLETCAHLGFHDTSCPNNPKNLKTYYIDTEMAYDACQAKKGQ